MKILAYLVGVALIVVGAGCVYYFGNLPFAEIELSSLEQDVTPEKSHVQIEDYFVYSDDVTSEANGPAIGYAVRDPHGAIYFPIQSKPEIAADSNRRQNLYRVIVKTNRYKSIDDFESAVKERNTIRGRLIRDDELDRNSIDQLDPNFQGIGLGNYWILLEGERGLHPWLLLGGLGIVIIAVNFLMNKRSRTEPNDSHDEPDEPTSEPSAD